VSREDKYKSKAVTDTFVYRGGDWLGAEAVGALRRAHGVGPLPAVAIPVCATAAAVGVVLARAAARRRARLA